MVANNPSQNTNLGFLTVLHEANGYLGGFLVTNSWGRPLEFRLSTAVQPNRVQQALYGGTLQPYIYADLIGKTLVEKTTTGTNLILTDKEPVLELRMSQPVPVAWLAAPNEPLLTALANVGAEVQLHSPRTERICCHPRYLDDRTLIRDVLDKLGDGLDLAEPFSRIREAILEGRKMGVTVRG